MLHQNIKDNLFVAAQFALFTTFFFSIDLGYSFPYFFRSLGPIVFMFGCLIAIIAIVQLNKNLTAFPTPKEKAILYTGGLYHFVRHPIYTGVIVIFLGLTLWWLSVYKLLITTLLAILFYFKSAYEEKQLRIKFEGYNAYTKATGRFLPRIF
jgi:protein-S-isoprenylcysteine O-methyltransferase Ste14